MKRKFAIGFLSASILLSVLGTENASAYNEDVVKNAENNITVLENKVKTFEEQREEKMKEIDELLLQLEILETQKESKTKEIEEQLKIIESSKEQIVILQSEIKKVQLEVKKTSTKVRSDFSKGEKEILGADKILKSNNPLDMVDKVYELKESVSNDKKQIDNFVNSLKTMEENIFTLQELQIETAEKREQSIKEKESIESSIKETEERKAELAKEVDGYENEVRKIQAEREEYINVLNKEIGMKASLSEGILEWPTVGGYISSGIGPRIHPVTGEIGRYHKGIDIARTDRSYSPPIYATESGVVVQAQYMEGYGNMVKIKHDDGSLETISAHLSEIKVKPGQKVRRGQTIGIMGTTGMSTGIHLHLEVYKDGNLENPLDYFKWFFSI